MKECQKYMRFDYIWEKISFDLKALFKSETASMNTSVNMKDGSPHLSYLSHLFWVISDVMIECLVCICIENGWDELSEKRMKRKRDYDRAKDQKCWRAKRCWKSSQGKVRLNQLSFEIAHYPHLLRKNQNMANVKIVQRSKISPIYRCPLVLPPRPSPSCQAPARWGPPRAWSPSAPPRP